MLSKRLQIIANLIPKDSNVADIGCDHGYLLIYLKDNHFNGKLLGIDNKKGPLESFRNNLIQKKYENKITIKLSDGLKDVDNNFNTIVIAGMGFDNIKKIVLDSKEKLDNIETFIIDSHTKEPEVRKFFVKLAYKIEEELIIEENGIFYEIIKFVKGNKEYSEIEYKFGPILIKEKSDIFKKKWNKKLLKNNEIIKNNNIENTKKNTFEEENKIIQKIINSK